MSHTYTQNHLHVVFSTKERARLIAKRDQPKLWSYMAGIGRNHGFLVIANGGMEDHVHLLIQLPPALALAKAVLLLKSNSSKWMNERHQIELAGRIWRLQRERVQYQRGYALHREPGDASSQDLLRAGIRCIA